MGKGSKILTSLNATRIKGILESDVRYPNILVGSLWFQKHAKRIFPKTGGRFLGPTKAPMNKTGT